LDRCDGSVRKDRFNRRVVLVGLTYTRVDRIGKRVKSPIDNMISQIFRSLSKVVYVGVSATFSSKFFDKDTSTESQKK
jgi:hypothetical protein